MRFFRRELGYPRAVRPTALASLPALALALAACEFTIADWYYVDRVRVMGTRATVVDFDGSPERIAIGLDPLDPPITEPLPGDVLRLEPIVVDAEGRPIDPASIDALWFQCGPDRCVRDDALLEGLSEACVDIPDLTMDTPCRVGSGGALEFEVPPVGPLTLANRYAYYYMVAGVPGERSAESCWAARRAERESLEGCLFAERELKIGPSWLLLLQAYTEQGLATDIPVFEIPGAAYYQPANRVPAPPLVLQRLVIDGVSFGMVLQPHELVRRGELLSIDTVEFRELDYQPFFAAQPTTLPGVFVFTGGRENPWVEWYTSGSLARVDEGVFRAQIDVLVDEQAEIGSTHRLILLYGDDRGSMDMVVYELEVVE